MWDSFIALSLGIGLVLFARSIIAQRKRNPRRLPLPPGPRGLPLLGNIFQFPQARPCEAYVKLCEKHGDIVYLKALNQGVVVLGSHRRAVDLMDKRSANYSDRPTLPIIEMADFGWGFGLMSYGAVWRQHSRTFHRYFNNSVVRQFHPIMYEETKAFLRKVNSQPSDIFEDMEFLFGVELMRAAYGFADGQRNKALIDNALSLISRFTDAKIPGRFLVNYLPVLRHVPSWFPGAGFKKFFKELAHLSFKTVYPPFEEAKHEFIHGETGKHFNMAADLIDNLPEESDANYATLEDIARSVCAVGYVAGAETTASSGAALFYVLANYPEVQAKAQSEIDAIVGSDRLPLVTDRERLPYVHAVVKEVGRWHTVAPLGGAHTNTEDDEYDGYFIPKGTIIVPNVWATMHDPAIFEKPFEYIPERYIKDGRIDPSVPDTELAVFGYGRRMCPGRHFSNDAMFLMAASFLATYTIAAPKDETGNVAPMKLDPSQTAISKPVPIKCKITLRAGREHLLE